MPFSDYKTALVTGASSGMGYAIATRLAAEGLTVHALARGQEGLDKLQKETGCITHAIDITDTDAIEERLATLEIDILINNAGVSRSGDILKSTRADVDDQIDINFKAGVHLARLTLPGMMERNCGHIINITSIAGHYEFMGNTVYHASKAAMHTISRQLRVSAYGHDVRVTEVSPGRVETDIFARVENISPSEAYERFFEDYECPKVEDVVNAVAYAIDAPVYVNLGMIELMPTLQVPGGLRTGTKSEFVKNR